MKKSAAAQVSGRKLIGSVVLVIVSLCIRRVGVALIPALLYTVIFQSAVRNYIMRLSIGMKVTIVFLAASLGGSMAWVISTTRTLSDFRAILTGHTVIDSAVGIMEYRLKELGEIAVNMPFTAIPPILQGIIPVIGALTFAFVFVGVAGRNQFGVIEIYFVSYVAVILVWPFYDPRFWLPVIPFLIVYVGLALRRLIQGKTVIHIVEGYVMVFVTMGMLSLASDTMLSFSGSGFGDLYTGQYHSTYCAVWHCKDSDSTKIDPDGLRLLRYYKQN
jgi:hypothetical protein